MKIAFWLISILISVYIGYAYIPEIFKWKIKPHAFSWLPWTILTGIAFIIQVQNGENIWWYGTLATSALICLIVFLLSLKYWERLITRGDTLSLIACLILIGFWLKTKSDIWALILICIIDGLAFFPTWRKSYLKPREENISMYFLSSIKSLLSLFSLKNFIIVNWLYLVFLVIINLWFTVYLIWRRKIIKQ